MSARLTSLADPRRLAALEEAALMDTPPEESFDRLSRLALRLLDARAASIALLDERREFIKSIAGAPDAALPDDAEVWRPLARTVVEEGRPVAIAALARETPRGAGAYLGVPIATAEGYVVGVLGVVAATCRAWREEEVDALADLAGAVGIAVDARRAQARAERATRALQGAESRFHAIVEQTLAGLYAVREGRFLYVNPRWAEMFGRPVEWFAGRSIFDIVHPDDRDRVATLVEEARGGAELGYACRGVRGDGSVVQVEVHGRVVTLEGVRAVVGVGLDVTERMHADRDREAAIAARDRFYAMVSHELRTPVSAVMLYNDLLLSDLFGPLNPEQRDAMERSQRCAGDLLALINDLLDLSKLEAGRLEAHLEEVELGELVDSAAAAVAGLARRNGCVVRVEVEPRPFPLLGDARRIRQILLNLLSNAVKFGEGRPVDIAVVRVPGGVGVEVRDLGPGISAEDLPRIFEDFVQLGDNPGTGTGLGLPIARRLAEMLGGALEVASTPGCGSTFRLVLPA